MLKEYLEEVGKPGQQANPLFNFLGVVVEEISGERVILRLPLRRDFIQGAGVVAGGVMAALADEAMAHLVLANLLEGEITATIEMNMRFVRPVSTGEIRAEAVVVKKGRNVFTLSVEVMDQSGSLLARGGASFMVIPVS